jgi:hypothetical protein
MGGGGVLEESPGRLLQVRPLPDVCCQSVASPARRAEKATMLTMIDIRDCLMLD